jgi:hypothetical protein
MIARACAMFHPFREWIEAKAIHVRGERYNGRLAGVNPPPPLAGPGFNILAFTIQDTYARHPTYTRNSYS